MITILDNVVSVFLNLINFNCNLIIVPEKPHWGGDNKVCMYVCITEYKSNVKNTWRILNEIINRRRCNLTRPSTFRVADREISDPVEIANGFCDYFTNLGPSLAGKIPTSNKPFSSFLKSDVVNSVFFPSTYQQEIVEICPRASALFDLYQ